MEKKDVWWMIVLTLAIVGFFLKLFIPYPRLVMTPDFGRSDAFHMSISTKYFLWEKLHTGEIPLWSKNIDAGFPVYAEGQIGTLYLPNLVLYRFLDFVTAYNLSLILAILLFGWGSFLWFKSEKFSSLAAFFGSTTLTFSGIIFTHLTHITLLQSLSLMPWIIFITGSLCRNPRFWKACLLALILSQQLFAGFVQAVFITIIFLTGYVAWNMKLNTQKTKTLVYLCTAFLVFIGLSMVFILPAREFLSQSTDPNGFSPAFATQFSYPIKHLLSFLDPFTFGNPRLGTYPLFWDFDGSIFWENTGYVGVIPLIFAIVGLIRFKKKRHSLTIFFLIGLFVSLMLMNGSRSPLYLIYSIWPFNLFRVPSRFLWTFTLFLVSMGAIGADRFLNTKWRWAPVILMILTGVNIFMLWQTWSNYNTFEPAKEWLSPPQVLNLIPHSGRVTTLGAVILHNKTFLNTGWQHMEPYIFLKNTLYPNSNLLWHVPHLEASVGRFLRRNTLMNELINDPRAYTNEGVNISSLAARLLSLNSVEMLISAQPATTGAKLKLLSSVTDDKDHIYVYKNATAWPRTYMAKNIYKAETLKEATKILTSEDFYKERNVLLEESLP
ncbi:MAG: hypothetical protein AAB874_01625, partial [Patescibacteria group bacterium]